MNNAKEIYDSLWNRIKKSKIFLIKCIVAEDFIPLYPLPFQMFIEDGVYHCKVVATSRKDAIMIVTDTFPVVKILKN